MLHWVIYAQHFSTLWWSHLHWTFNPCQWHHHMSKTLCTNHPVIWHYIPAGHTNQLRRCWNLKAHKGRPLFTTGLSMSCYIRQQVENYSLLRGFKATEYTIFLDLKYTLYKLINSDSKRTLKTCMYCLAQHNFMVYITINYVIFDNFKACESQHYFAGGMWHHVAW